MSFHPFVVEAACKTIVHRLAERGPEEMLVAGLCGAQGAGKSTLADAIVATLAEKGIAAAVLSLDDLYLTRAERQDLARDVHPLFATRGVPGTHDLTLGHAVFDALGRGEAVALPRFDKASDDRAPQAGWPVAGPLRVLLFEGWCVGARAQPDSFLVRPVNALEAWEDRDGIWRGAVNDALAGPYQDLFARIDLLILLAAPDFDVVVRWRAEQEAALRRRHGDGAGMDPAAIVRFVAHYERLTRWILDEMPRRADLGIELDGERRPLSLVAPGPALDGDW